MAVPWGNLIPARSRVLPQGGAVLGQLTGTFQQGLAQGRQRAAEDEAPNLVFDYLDTLGQGYQPTLGNLATPAAGYVGGQPAAPTAPTSGLTPVPDGQSFAGTPRTGGGAFGLTAGALTPEAPAPQPTSGMEQYRNAITNIESGGRYDLLGPIANASGDRAYGRYQVMGANIPSWTEQALGVRMTPEQFLASPAAQDAVFDHIFGGYVRQYGPEGAARAWFTGSPTGTGTDVLGTTADRYVQMFNGGMGGAAPTMAGGGGAAPSAGGGYTQQAAWAPPVGAERQALRALIMNPVTREMGIQLATQRMTPPAPQQPNWTIQEHNGTLYRIDANTGRVEPLVQGQPAGPEPTDDMREYEYAVARGFTGTFPEWQMMRPPSTVVNNNQPGQPMIGTIPPAWQATELEGGGFTMAPVPGGPAEIELEQNRQAAEINAAFAQRQTDTLMTTLANAEEIIQRNPGGTTGWGELLARLPASESRTLQSLLDTTRAIIGFDTLQSMREASPTGGALGAITERELAFLQSVQGSLDQGLSADVLLRNIQAIAASVQRWNQAMQAARGPGSAAQAGIPPGAPTATNPQTGEVVYWNGTAWVAP